MKQNNADDLALEWITKYTLLAVDGRAYQELVRAFLQFRDSKIDELKLKIIARDTFLKRIAIDPQKVIVDGIDMGVYGYNDEIQTD